MNDYVKEELEDILETLCAAKDRAVSAYIDAGACRTQRDWENAHKAEDAFYKEKDNSIKRIAELFGLEAE